MCAVVQAFDFTELQCINHKADKSVSRKPCAVMLITRFVAQADPVGFHHCMPAGVENCGQGSRYCSRPIKIGRDVQPRKGLEMEFLDHELVMFNLPCDRGLQIRSDW